MNECCILLNLHYEREVDAVIICGLEVAAVAVFRCRCDVVCIVDKEGWMKEAVAVAFRCWCGEQQDVGGRKGGKRIKMKIEGDEEADPKIMKEKILN